MGHDLETWLREIAAEGWEYGNGVPVAADVADLLAELARLRAAHQIAADKWAQAVKQREELRADLSAMTQRYHNALELCRQREEDRQEAWKENAALKERVAALDLDNEDLRSACAEYRAELHDHEQMLQEAEARAEALRAERDELKEQVTALHELIRIERETQRSLVGKIENALKALREPL